MRIDEVECVIVEKMAWARKGNSVVRKVRCSGGPRNGKLVSSSADCSKPKSINKSITLKKTKNSKGKRMARKSNKTKRVNQNSRRAAALNKHYK